MVFIELVRALRSFTGFDKAGMFLVRYFYFKSRPSYIKLSLTLTVDEFLAYPLNKKKTSEF